MANFQKQQDTEVSSNRWIPLLALLFFVVVSLICLWAEANRRQQHRLPAPTNVDSCCAERLQGSYTLTKTSSSK
jgi:hypothetical protein